MPAIASSSFCMLSRRLRVSTTRESVPSPCLIAAAISAQTTSCCSTAVQSSTISRFRSSSSARSASLFPCTCSNAASARPSAMLSCDGSSTGPSFNSSTCARLPSVCVDVIVRSSTSLLCKLSKQLLSEAASLPVDRSAAAAAAGIAGVDIAGLPPPSAKMLRRRTTSGLSSTPRSSHTLTTRPILSRTCGVAVSTIRGRTCSIFMPSCWQSWGAFLREVCSTSLSRYMNSRCRATGALSASAAQISAACSERLP
mmetsp:Transcript_15089/g.38286  ORF Transcript_15089/g.38286 Transcript_15089/m.38286 type:complete len:255 (+) Transcript_15089:295-1059(+)